MLVISLKVGEQLKFGRDITVTVLESKTGKARLGIEAPLKVEISKVKPETAAKSGRQQVKTLP